MLAQAEDRRLPLLERMKFLAIFASNLDEFYMVRVAGLKRRLDMGLGIRSSDGRTARETLTQVSLRTQELVARHSALWQDDVEPALAGAGIRVLHWDELDAAERSRLAEYFRAQVFPVLTPLAVDPSHPFPYISGLSLNLAVLVRDTGAPGGATERFARVKVPNNVARFVDVKDPRAASAYLPMEDLIAAHLDMLFPGLEVVEHHLFRVTRNTDIEVEEDRDEDLLQALERTLTRRRFGPAVRLEVQDTITPRVLDLLTEEIDVPEEDVFYVPGLLDLASLWQVYDVDRPDLKEAAVRAVDAAAVRRERDGQERVRHPAGGRRARAPPVRVVRHERAAVHRAGRERPERAGDQADPLPHLRRLADRRGAHRRGRGRQAGRGAGRDQGPVRRAGQHQAGPRRWSGPAATSSTAWSGLKTHCKTALVVRQEGGSIRRYCHIGTGNYNPKTARHVRGPRAVHRRPGRRRRPHRPVQRARPATRGRPSTARSSWRRTASAAASSSGSGGRSSTPAPAGSRGFRSRPTTSSTRRSSTRSTGRRRPACEVDLLVRTFCTIRAGVPGLSENLRVRSILGRFLEHSRIICVENDGEPEYLLGSADLMHRNLDRRVEVMVQVTDPTAREHLRDTLDLAFADDVAAWELRPDDVWTRNAGQPGKPLRDYQEVLMRRHASRAQ